MPAPAGAQAGGTTPFAPLLRLMEAPILAACERDRPDLIVADFVTFAASKVALQIDIPLVVNVPGASALLMLAARPPCTEMV